MIDEEYERTSWWVEGMHPVSAETHTALTNLVEAIGVLETNHPAITCYAEYFTEILMNFFPAHGDNWYINPHPVVDVHVLNEDNECVAVIPGAAKNIN